jgi:branched-chain amino acid aminotransferase
MAAPRHVWVDGQMLPAGEPHLSAFDRGFQLGDGAFETLRARAGRPAELDRHLDRLRHSTDALEIRLPADATTRIEHGIEELLDAEGLAGPDGDAALRITVSRGAIVARGLIPADASTPPTIVIQAWPVMPAPADHLERGLSLISSSVRRDPTNPLAAIKTTSRVDYVFARLEARHAGADDALFLTIDGYLSEATTANIFLIRGDELATPGLDCAILPGTTRDWILGWAPTVDLRPIETALTAPDLAAAEEAFLSSSVAGILPVTRFDGQPIGDGLPGERTRMARADRDAFIRRGR